MLELTEQNAAEILHARGHLKTLPGTTVRELSGGVSNAVFLVETSSAGDGPQRFVVKQARGKLRVQADWQCSVERIWREVEVLEAINDLMVGGENQAPTVPQIFWTDRELYAYAMTAADADCSTWKAELMKQRVDVTEAMSAGMLLGRIHAASWHRDDLAKQFKDRTYFAQLRLEPYYLAAAEKYRPLANQLSDLVNQTWREQHALVHGDFSPKNLLVGHGMMLIDFEVGHYGDPAFDLGFCLTHLVLKAIHFPKRASELLGFGRSFHATAMAPHIRRITEGEWKRLEQRTVQHLAGCLVARVHGKSPVDYLTPHEQSRAVRLAEQLFELGDAAVWEAALQLLKSELGS